MSAGASFPFPVPEFGAEPYWEACNRGELAMQRCDDCSHIRWIPGPLCPECGAGEHGWVALAGRGRVTTWTVITHPVHPAAVDRVPYVVAEVELEEQPGLRMITGLVGIEADAIEFDLPVEVEFEQHASGQKLPVFRPVG
jgi:uncharacterized OB-fold protein